MLRKGRSGFLANACACGSRAIVLSRPVIPRKSSAERIVSWPRSSLSGRDAGRKPGGGPTKDTAEQIAVEPSIGSRAGPIACGRNSLLQLSSSLPWLIQINRLKRRARVIQIAQKLTGNENLLANDQAVVRIGLSIREHRTKSSVARYATTLCAPQ